MVWVPPAVRGAIASSIPPPPSSALYNVGSTVGLEMWLNAQNGVTGDPVTNWADQHTSNRNLTGGFSNTLTVSPTTYNGLTSLNYAANTIFPTLSTPFNTSTGWTIWLCCTTTSDSIWLISQIQVRLDTSGSGDVRYNNVIVGSPTNSVANLNLYTFVYDGVTPNLRIYQNGVEQYNGTVNVNNSAWTRTPARAFGNITDMLIYSTSGHTNSEHNVTGSNIASRYGLSWTNIT
jgi:hypothetical protein